MGLLNDALERLIEQEEQKMIARVQNDNGCKTFKEKYEWLVTEIDNLLEESISNTESFKEDGLTFNTLENEGFRRGLLTIKRRQESIESYFKEEWS